MKPLLGWELPRVLGLVLLLALGLGLAACETSEGFGRDLQSLGKDIEDEAD